MTPEARKAQYLMDHPATLGRMLGYKDLRDEIHGVWIDEMTKGAGDMHTTMYASTCCSEFLSI